MTKQKIVIKVVMTSDKCRSKAMALALVAATGGVDSVALAGDDKDQVEVVGDGVDSVNLTRALRTKIGPAHLVKVADAKKEEEDKKKKAEEAAMVEYAYSWPHYYNNYPPYPAGAYGYQYHSGPPDTCSIM